MRFTRMLDREETISECISAVWPLMGDEHNPVADAMLDALRALKSQTPLIVTRNERVDYLTKVQERARHTFRVDNDMTIDLEKNTRSFPQGQEHEAIGTVETPLGTLRCYTWMRPWKGEKRSGSNWVSQYTLDFEPISIREIKRVDLALRPHARIRHKSVSTQRSEEV